MITLFDTESIIYLQAENKRCYVVTTSGYFTISKSLTDLTADLPEEDFFRIHRSATINLKYIKAFDENSVTLDNGTTLPLSRYKYKAFLEAFSLQMLRHKKSSV